MATICAHNPQYLDLWTEFPVNDLILYMSFIIEYHQDHVEEADQLFLSKMNSENCTNFLIKVLSEAELSPAWLEVMRYIVQRSENYSSIIEFVPMLRAVPQNPALYSHFYDLYKDVNVDWIIVTDYGNPSTADVNINILSEFIMILVNIIETLFNIDGSDAEAIQFASLTWNEIIDYEWEFFVGRPVEFTQTLLQKFLMSLRIIANEPSEFIRLINYTPVSIMTIAQKCNVYIEIVMQYIEVIIHVIDEHFDEYSDYCDELTNAIMNLTEFHELQVYPPQMYQYFAEKLKTNPTNGVIFAVSSASRNIVMQFAPFVAQYILSSNPPPQISLYFIRYCALSAPQFFPGLIGLVYTSFSQSANIPALRAISTLALKAPQIFIDNAQNLITPLVAWLQHAPPMFVGSISEALINIVARINPAEPQVQKMLEIISKVFGEQITTLIANDGQGMFNFLFDFIECVTRIFKNLDFLNDDGNIIKEFFNQMYDQIFSALAPIWLYQSDQTMALLCKFLSMSLKAGIVRNFEPIVNWIGQALYIAPIPDHISLLNNLNIVECLPTEPIMQFLQRIGQIDNDAELVLVSFQFIKFLLNNYAPIFAKFFGIEFLLSTFESPDNRVIEIAINIALNVLSSPGGVQFIVPIITTLVKGMFTNFSENDIRTSFQTMGSLINNGVCTAEQIIQLFGSYINVDSVEANMFRDTFMASPFNEQEVFKAAKPMLVLYKKLPPPTP